MRTEQALLKRDAELYEATKAEARLGRDVAHAISQVEVSAARSLSTISARLDARSECVSALRRRVERALDAQRGRRLDDAWVRLLDPKGRARPRRPAPPRPTDGAAVDPFQAGAFAEAFAEAQTPR